MHFRGVVWEFEYLEVLKVKSNQSKVCVTLVCGSRPHGIFGKVKYLRVNTPHSGSISKWWSFWKAKYLWGNAPMVEVIVKSWYLLERLNPLG